MKVDSSFTSSTSEICATSSSAATRGSSPLLKAEAPATTCVKLPDFCMARTAGVHSSARPLSMAASSTIATDVTPGTAAAASAAALQELPPIMTVTGPSAADAVMAARVGSASLVPSCSPTSSVESERACGARTERRRAEASMRSPRRCD